MRVAHRGVLVMVAAVVATAVGCPGGQQFVVRGSDRAAGADARIEIEALEGGNYQVQVDVENLLPPTRLADGLTTYVVWFQAADQPPQRVGLLAYNPESRAGSMMATTPHSAIQVIVSGEVAPDVAAPSEYVVFRASVEASGPQG